MAWDHNGTLYIAQRPEAATVARHFPTWSTFSFTFLTLADVNLAYSPLVMEINVSSILAALRAIESHTSGRFTLTHEQDHLVIAARSATTMSEARDLRPSQAGVLIHEVPVLGIKSRGFILREPTISPPTLTMQLTSGLGTLKNRLAGLKEGPNDSVILGVNSSGKLFITSEKMLFRTIMQFNIRIMTGSEQLPSTNTNNNLLRVSSEHLLRALGYQVNLSGATAIWAIIPDQMLIISVNIGNDALLTMVDHPGETMASITYFIPAMTETV